tara:strand:+ start:347 stop:697 length:351 start_codon:yes stop_codon:yes gene_type:complete
MAKKQINYSDLSTKELELLKDTYIDLKVKSMNNNDLKDFAIENISLQIKNTIGNDEELEAWQEMEEFFKDEFENIIRNILIQLRQKNDNHSQLHIEDTKLDSEDKGGDKKLDMWED